MQRKKDYALLACAVFCASLVSLTSCAGAHGFAGDRFFPPTITTDDPFAVDELSLPTVTYSSDSGVSERDYGFEFDKEIFPHFALGISDTYIAENGRGGGPSAHGWDDLTLTAKYEILHSEPHEAILAIGVEALLGGTGSRSVADSFSTISPTVYFGKGLGDLPENLAVLRPLAVTGTVSQTFSTSSRSANAFEWAFALEYSIPYMQQHVKDIGLPEPFKNMIPLVEFSFSTDENRDFGGITSGSINPGVLWEATYFQIGAEALLPINAEKGSHIGLVVQAWIYIDDLFPRVFGAPIFGRD